MKTCDKTELDRVAALEEDDRYLLGSLLGRRCCHRACDRDYCHLTLDKIGCQGRQFIVLSVRPAKFDVQVLTLNEAGFSEPLAECWQQVRERRP
jgi:hypothetical protein